MNTKNNKSVRPVGRPSAELKYPRGAFTVKDLFELNKGTVKWELTVRQHVEKQVESHFLTKLENTVQTGKPGRPNFKYIRTSVWKGVQDRKNKEVTVVNPAESDVVGVPATAVENPVVETHVSEVTVSS